MRRKNELVIGVFANPRSPTSGREMFSYARCRVDTRSLGGEATLGDFNGNNYDRAHPAYHRPCFHF